jgi:hypothetical protein
MQIHRPLTIPDCTEHITSLIGNFYLLQVCRGIHLYIPYHESAEQAGAARASTIAKRISAARS